MTTYSIYNIYSIDVFNILTHILGHGMNPTKWFSQNGRLQTREPILGSQPTPGTVATVTGRGPHLNFVFFHFRLVKSKVFTPCGIIFQKKNRKENHLPEARVVEPRFPGKPNINNNYQIHKSTFLVENGFCWSSSGFVTTYNGHIHCLISGLKPYTRLSKSRKM